MKFLCKPYFSYILVSLMLLSCNHKPANTHIVVGDFPKTIQMDSCAVVRIDSVVGLLSFDRAGDYFLGQLHKNPFVFQLFDADLNPLMQVARKGRGPHEFINASYLGQFEKNADSTTSVWILEMSARRFSKINLERAISTGTFIREKSYKFDEQDNTDGLRNLFHISDNRLIGTTDGLECKVIVVDLNNDTRAVIENFMPFSSPRILDAHKLSQNMCTIKPDKSKMASSFFNLPQIDLYNTNGDRYLTIFYEKLLRPEDTDQYNEKAYYLQVRATDKYVYALHQADTPSGQCSIQLFDWAGNPQAELFINTATNFCVEPDDSMLYTINFEDEQTSVRKYTLNVL